MLTQHRLVAFVATRNAPLARVFYEEKLGLRLVSDDPFAIVFDANGTMLRVQKVDSFVPHPFTALGWHVTDIEASIRGLVERGVTVERYDGMGQDDLGIWASPSGARVAWFKDPDGNTISLTEH